ncbi:MAG: 50S ribosomal protein L6 [Candidatus Sumerlaeota bacterium]|nr:50S ribosomal protein L6 [Candidatus Sumerlaeota bacterium]
MSRIGKLPIPIPHGVDVKVADGKLAVKGPKGALELDTRGHVAVRVEGGQLRVERPDDERQSRAFHGLYQRLASNMVKGVTQGFSKGLEIQGVGYRAQLEGGGLVLFLGYSHSIKYQAPPGIKIEVPDPTHVTVSGVDKQLVGQVAANIRKFRKPEPYKGKGIRYVGEYVRRKVGKTGVK